MKQTDLEKLLADMSLKEKVDQMLQLSGAFYLGDENSVLTGPANDMGIGKEDLEMAGSILGAAGADTMKKLQDDYMAKQPHHIPMLFMMDVIHGMKTIFPAPLAQGATFDPELSGECASEFDTSLNLSRKLHLQFIAGSEESPVSTANISPARSP